MEFVQINKICMKSVGLLNWWYALMPEKIEKSLYIFWIEVYWIYYCWHIYIISVDEMQLFSSIDLIIDLNNTHHTKPIKIVRF